MVIPDINKYILYKHQILKTNRNNFPLNVGALNLENPEVQAEFEFEFVRPLDNSDVQANSLLIHRAVQSICQYTNFISCKTIMSVLRHVDTLVHVNIRTLKNSIFNK